MQLHEQLYALSFPFQRKRSIRRMMPKLPRFSFRLSLELCKKQAENFDDATDFIAQLNSHFNRLQTHDVKVV